MNERTKKKISRSLKGKKRNWETKKKISETMKKKYQGENNPMYGRKHSDETKCKIGKAMKGKNNPMYKHSHSDETKRKISEALKINHMNNIQKLKNSSR